MPRPTMEADDYRYRLWARASLLGALAHLTLPDALQWTWLPADLLLLGGALAVAYYPREHVGTLLGFLASAAGLSWPLLLLGDQLTQSVYMLFVVVAGLLCRRNEGHFFGAVRLLTLGVYAAAIFHKMNADFFDPAVSCASGGLTVLSEMWSLPLAPDFLAPVWPYAFAASELSLVLLFVLRPRLALPFAGLMHIPLTIIFAPSFAWVMAPGWIAFMREEDLKAWAAIGRERRVSIVLLGLAGFGMGLAFYFQDHWVLYPAWQLKELALWILAAAFLTMSLRGPRVGRGAWSEPMGKVSWVLFALFLANASTPYLGVQFHHAGAMLSNLRIDEGCWNHLLVPESVRWSDPYIRVDAPEASEELRAEFEAALWHEASLRSAVRRHCAEGAAPLTLTIRAGGETRTLEDACEVELPRGRAGLFQTNLERECPQACVH
ncbi:MAG: hypothetical protein AB8H86_31565 [Polyangiales bacterium]